MANKINNLPEVRHSLKGSLTKINLYSEALLAGSVGKLSAVQQDYVKEISQASQEMAKTINETLYPDKKES